MRKYICLLTLALVLAGAGFSSAEARQSSDLQAAINMYKAGNYSGCIQKLEPVLKKDPSNAFAHYYMAMSCAQAGRPEEAINHYNTVIRLNSQETLVRYATRGKLCLEDAEKCASTSSLDDFIHERRGFDVTNAVQNSIETQKLDSIRRDINDNKEITPERLKQYKRFSSSSEIEPSNDEIVAALRTLQKAGLSSPVVSPYSNLGSVYAGIVPVNNQNAVTNLVDLLGSSSCMSNSGREKIDPRVLQTLMTSQMMGL